MSHKADRLSKKFKKSPTPVLTETFSDHAVLPDCLDQLPPRKVLITVILATVKRAEVCNRA